MLYYRYNNYGEVISNLDQNGIVKNEYGYDAFEIAITEKGTNYNMEENIKWDDSRDKIWISLKYWKAVKNYKFP